MPISQISISWDNEVHQSDLSPTRRTSFGKGSRSPLQDSVGSKRRGIERTRLVGKLGQRSPSVRPNANVACKLREEFKKWARKMSLASYTGSITQTVESDIQVLKQSAVAVSSPEDISSCTQYFNEKHPPSSRQWPLVLSSRP